MIELTSGDILKDDSDAIVNTVNCVGIMGRGIALQFKNAWPENFKAYQAACKREEVQPGRMFVYEVGQLTTPRFIINFPSGTERQEPHRGHRFGPDGAGERDSRARHPLGGHPAAGQRAWRAGVERRSAPHRGGLG